MSAPIARPIHNQSQPFNGKTIVYIRIVHGAKIKPKRLTSQGKLKFANDAFTRTGARSHQTRKPSLGPANIRTAKKQHIFHLLFLALRFWVFFYPNTITDKLIAVIMGVVICLSTGVEAGMRITPLEYRIAQ
jgi:hypothetical protein